MLEFVSGSELPYQHFDDGFVSLDDWSSVDADAMLAGVSPTPKSRMRFGGRRECLSFW